MYTGEREVRVTRKTNNTENLKIDKIVFAQTLSVGFLEMVIGLNPPGIFTGCAECFESTRYFYWLRRIV